MITPASVAFLSSSKRSGQLSGAFPLPKVSNTTPCMGGCRKALTWTPTIHSVNVQIHSLINYHVTSPDKCNGEETSQSTDISEHKITGWDWGRVPLNSAVGGGNKSPRVLLELLMFDTSEAELVGALWPGPRSKRGLIKLLKRCISVCGGAGQQEQIETVKAVSQRSCCSIRGCCPPSSPSNWSRPITLLIFLFAELWWCN